MGRFAILMGALGLLISSAMAMDGTRIAVAAGGDLPFGNTNSYSYDPAGHVRVVVDAPPIIREHIPLEAVLSFSGKYIGRKRGVKSVCDGGWGPVYYTDHYSYYEPRYSGSAAVRIYMIGHRADGNPNALEAGLGIGVHQFISDKVEYHGGPKIRTQHDVQFRGSGFVRIQFAPTQPQGVFLEVEMQRALDDHHNSFLPVASLLATLGFRIHIY